MIKCNNGNCKQIKYNRNDVKYLNLNGTIVWAKPYIITILRGGGVNFITVKRLNSLDPSASIGYIYSGDMIFHGDKLEVSAGATSQFELNPYTSQYIVNGDLTIQVTAKQVLFDVEIRAVYNKEVLSSTIKYSVPLGTTIYSYAVYGSTFKSGDYVYSNPNYSSRVINSTGIILTTTYTSRMNPIKIKPVLSYQYLDEDVSQERFYFELYIYDPGHIGGRVFLCETDSPTITESNMIDRQRYVGNLNTDYEFTYSVITTYDKPNTYIHVRINRGDEYTYISTIHISA